MFHTHAHRSLSAYLNWAWWTALAWSEAAPKKFKFRAVGRYVATLQPVHDPVTAHEIGLDFSRCCALAALWHATRETQYAQQWRAHWRAGWKLFRACNHNYEAAGHWISNFGMLALRQVLSRK